MINNVFDRASTLDPAYVWWHMHYLGILVATTWAVIRTPKDFPINKNGVLFVFLLVIFPSFFGARVFHTILYSSKYYGNMRFMDAFSKMKGAGYLGALLAQFSVVFAYSKLRSNKISFLKMMDYMMPFFQLQAAFGRIGCFKHGCCYGKPTNLPWGQIFVNVDPVPRHPTQIYYAMFLLGIFFFMRHLYNKKDLPAGNIFFLSIFLYGLCRFFGEFLRVDSPQVLGVITLAQVGMLTTMCVGGLGIYLVKKSWQK